MKALNGTWIAYGGGSADKIASDNTGGIKIEGDDKDEDYSIKRLFLSKQELNEYYYGYSNSVLWPLCHIVYVKPQFNSNQFLEYDNVNRKFAQAIINEIGSINTVNSFDLNDSKESRSILDSEIPENGNTENTENTEKEHIVWLQDYHLARCAKYIKEYDKNIKVSMFWHIPWPNPEIFSICPEKTAILEGLLANDLIGFQIIYHCQNFLRTCEWELEAQVNWADYTVTYQGHKTKVMPFPISVDVHNIYHLSMSDKVENIIMNIKANDEIIEPPYKFLALSVDRLDYTKGIIEKLLAIDKLLEKYPELLEKFVFVQFGVLSRTHIKAYKELNDEINRLSEEINWKYGMAEWYPIVRYFKQLDLETYLAYYRMADAVIVSPLHDGMNLVCKEYISANIDYKGILILSKFAGASKELGEAILVNPFNIECFAESIYRALMMEPEEKKRRIEKMQNVIKENDIFDWAYNFLLALYLI